MPYPNSALSAWQLAIMAVVAVTALAGWLTAVFLAAREPRGDQATTASGGTTESVAAGTTTPPAAGEPEPTQQAGSQVAA